MNFNEIIKKLKYNFNELVNEYDGLIVKKLESSNTLEEDRTTHQTHIAITGDQMDLFPYLSANKYFNCEYETKNDLLKKYFVLRIPMKIFKNNVELLLKENEKNEFNFHDSNEEVLNVCILRSRRNNQSDQIQLSFINDDDKDFILFRRLLMTNDYLVILKVKDKLEYECLGIREGKFSDELMEMLKDINNKLILLDNSKTLVNIGDIIVESYNSDISIEELSEMLLKMYNNAYDNFKVAAIHMFGIKYGKLILEKKFKVKDIINLAKLNQSYETELSKGINIYKCLNNDRYGIKIIFNEKTSIEEKSRLKNGYNKIYYGTPGCGKSYLVNKEYNEEEYMVTRTTFYPDYSNSDFVGQIIPKLEDVEDIDGKHLKQVYYEFQEGPFSIALLNAFKNPNKKVCLIIEEINRGNASAIFGDIFQLLDRDNDGNSIYKINNDAIKNYLSDNGVNNVNKIYIPSNMWIIGTMNTCDQNVYALDTAFKRRWKMAKIPNKFADDNKLANMYIPGSNYTWKEFVEIINKAILENNPGGLNGEDKQLGVYFVSDNELVVSKETKDCKEAVENFAEKVLMYIWEDIAKIDPTLWFSSDFKSFDELLDAFSKKHLDIFKGVFEESNKLSEENII